MFGKGFHRHCRKTRSSAFPFFLKEDFIMYVFRELPASVRIPCWGGEDEALAGNR